MAGTSYISFRRLSQFWEKAKAWIDEQISGAVAPEAQKEVFKVLTYASSAPTSAEDGDYYINSSENKLYYYDEDEWVEATPSSDSIFIATDTNHMYVLSNGTYVDVTGESVDNIIYTNNIITGLDVTEAGLYTVCYTTSSNTYWYSLTVSVIYGPSRPGRPRTVSYNQILSNNECWQQRNKRGSEGTWTDWEEHTYAYTSDIEDLKPLIYAGL